jgi:hypothetical protein
MAKAAGLSLLRPGFRMMCMGKSLRADDLNQALVLPSSLMIGDPKVTGRGF